MGSQKKNKKSNNVELPELESFDFHDDVHRHKISKEPFRKYRGKFKTSFWSIVLGMLLILIGFVFIGYSEGSHSEINAIRRMTLMHAEKLGDSEKGMMKIVGTPESKCALNLDGCDHEDVIYYSIITEKLDGDDWVQIKSERSWSDFKLGSIKVVPANAEGVFDFKHSHSINEYEKNEGEQSVKYRETIYEVYASEELIVIGNVKNQTIEGGNQFIITNKNHKDLVKYFVGSDRLEWWFGKGFSLLLLVLGAVSFLLPIISFLDIFPGFGWGLVSVMTLIALVINTIVVFFVTMMLTFWWLIMILVLFVFYLIVKIKGREKELPNSFLT
ncbi:hypothetical protein KKD70_00335 [Patescibacteria group bacterium]|nr:hypothetical protein [Patescibacteria group bacterium]